MAIPLFLLKVVLVKVASLFLCKVLSDKCRSFLRFAKVLFLYEFLYFSSSTIFCMAAFFNRHFDNVVSNFHQKLNCAFLIVISFFCLMAPFLIFLFLAERERNKAAWKIIKKTAKTKSERKARRIHFEGLRKYKNNLILEITSFQ